MSDAADVLGLEPDDLDGHTIDELTDYLERGRQPADASIDNSPSCQIALGALQRLRDLADAYLDDRTAGTTRTDTDWISAVLAAIPVDARAGRRFPWASDEPDISAYVTEGAIRGLVRAVGDDVPGLLVGSVRIGSGAPTPLLIDVALVYGAVLSHATDRLRETLRQVLTDHLPFTVGAIDIHVVGVIEAPAPTTRSGRR